jgi:hypothetical protein
MSQADCASAHSPDIVLKKTELILAPLRGCFAGRHDAVFLCREFAFRLRSIIYGHSRRARP